MLEVGTGFRRMQDRSLKTDSIALFSIGFIPSNIPITGDRQTIADILEIGSQPGGSVPHIHFTILIPARDTFVFTVLAINREFTP